jgi:hypothetical protein
MKKVLALLAIVGFVACNSAENTEVKTDSTATTPTVDTTAPKAADTTAPKADTTAAAPAATPAK